MFREEKNFKCHKIAPLLTSLSSGLSSIFRCKDGPIRLQFSIRLLLVSFSYVCVFFLKLCISTFLAIVKIVKLLFKSW